MNRKNVTAIIEANVLGFTIYSDNLPGITGHGETIEDAKRNIKESISQVLKRHYQKRTKPPIFLSGVSFIWIYKYDVESIFKYFPLLDSTSFIKNLKLHPTLLYQHKTGITLASEKQMQKIINSLHSLGRELLSIRM